MDSSQLNFKHKGGYMRKKLGPISLLIGLSIFATCLLMLQTHAAHSQEGQHGVPILAESGEQLQPVIEFDVKHDVSPPLRSMKPLPPQSQPHRAIPFHLINPNPAPVAQTEIVDPVAQQFQGAALAGSIGLNFDGQSADGVVPPDANGAVGATQYVQWVNTTFAVYNKSNGTLIYGPAEGNTLWQGFGGQCQNYNSGDPIAKYDQFAGRWVMMQPVFTSPYYVCIAVSTTSDATGSYYRYAFSMDNFPDYPKLGVWVPVNGQGAAYFWSANMYNGNTFEGAKVCAFNRGAMLTGGSAQDVCYQLGTYGGYLESGTLLPADIDGSGQPFAGEPEYFFNLGAQHQIGRFTMGVDFSKNPPTSSINQLYSLTPASYQETCSAYSTRVCVAQPNTSQTLASLSYYMMNRAAYRKFSSYEDIVLTHSVQGTTGQQDDFSGIRWYELRTSGYDPNIYQQGTYVPDTNYRWMGSIAMDKLGDIVAGYSLSSNVNHPSILVIGRTPSDPSGTMEQEVYVIRGSGSQVGDTNAKRWGDYDSMTIDPVNDCTFWYTNEYLPSTGEYNWHTRIVTFKFSNCQ